MMFIGPWELIIVLGVGFFFVGAILAIVGLAKRKDQE